MPKKEVSCPVEITLEVSITMASRQSF